MKRIISRVFLLLSAVTLIASSSYGQCSANANGEATLEPPAGWTMPGFQPNSLSPLTGTKSYRTNGFFSDQVYTIKTPVSELTVTKYNVLSINFNYAQSTAFFKNSPTTTPDPTNSGTWNIYINLVDLTNDRIIQLGHLSGALMPATPKTGFSATGPDQLATCIDGSCNTKIKYYFEIVCISSNYHTSTSNWIKIDDIITYNAMCNLPIGGPGISLSVQNSQEDQSTGFVHADLNLFKDSEQVGSTTEHEVLLFAIKKQVSDDAVIGIELSSTVTVSASSGTSNTQLSGFLVNDGTYYYEYYVALAESYQAQNNAFPKIESSASTPQNEIQVWNDLYESITLEKDGEQSYISGSSYGGQYLEEDAVYAMNFPEVSGTKPGVNITYYSDVNATVPLSSQTVYGPYPVNITIPAGAKSIRFEYN